jgi:hypothetical protein
LIDFSALEAARGLQPTAKNISRLADEFGPEKSSWAFNQWALRAKARAKFEQPDEMLFTQVGLEQASHESVAAYHASLFPNGAYVADLTCGNGGDLRALSKRGPAVGYELDATTASYAGHNAPGARVVNEDCLTIDWDFKYAYADPARRVGYRRTLDPDAFSPNPRILAERMKALEFGLMKLSPMLQDDFLLEISPNIEFVSFEGECREALAWIGHAPEFGFRAVNAQTGDRLDSGGRAGTSDEPGEFLFEADPAAIRAHCLPTLCERINGLLLGDSNGYLTSNSFSECSWLRGYRVLEHGSFDVKRLRVTLRKCGGGTPEIKTRVKTDVIELRKKLSMEGEGRPIVILYASGKSVKFAIAETI